MTVSAQQRRFVFERAGRCCEYCRFGGGRQPVDFHTDHIVAVKHGADVAAIGPFTNEATRLFNPRQQDWDEHFQIESDASLSGLTPEGRATVLVLRMNEAPRIEQRFGEQLLGNYPCQSNP